TQRIGQGAGKLAFGAGQLGVGASAMAAVPSALAMGAVGGGLNAGIAKLQGKDPFSAAGKGFSEGFRMRGVTRITDPRISAAAGAILPKAGAVGRQLITRGVTGAGNVAEDEVINYFNGQKTGWGDRLASFGLGAA